MHIEYLSGLNGHKAQICTRAWTRCCCVDLALESHRGKEKRADAVKKMRTCRKGTNYPSTVPMHPETMLPKKFFVAQEEGLGWSMLFFS
jgi:hypothetical protein